MGIRHEHMCFVVIPKDGKEEVEEVHAEVVDFFGEFLILYKIMNLMDYPE